MLSIVGTNGRAWIDPNARNNLERYESTLLLLLGFVCTRGVSDPFALIHSKIIQYLGYISVLNFNVFYTVDIFLHSVLLKYANDLYICFRDIFFIYFFQFLPEMIYGGPA